MIRAAIHLMKSGTMIIYGTCLNIAYVYVNTHLYVLMELCLQVQHEQLDANTQAHDIDHSFFPPQLLSCSNQLTPSVSKVLYNSALNKKYNNYYILYVPELITHTDLLIGCAERN